MRVALLGSGSGWHVRDLARAARTLDHEASIFDFRRVWMALPDDQSELRECDAIIVRTMPPGSLEQVVFRMDVLHRLEALGIRIVNPPRALETCIDKYLASTRLAAAGLPVPHTAVCQDAETAMEAFATLGGDVVVKPLFGSEGRGMVRASDPESAWRIFRTLERLQAVLYIQEFVAHPGWDLRAFVIGDKVLTAIRRRASGDWRTNVAQGGRPESVSLTAEEERLALDSARAVGAVVAGVDLLPRPEGGYAVLEVNAVPGWRALGPATGIDVAQAIINHVAEI